MHESVLLKETIDNLNLNDNSIIVDCTLGYGGHSSEILKKTKTGFLYAFDQDIDAIEFSQNRLNQISSNYEIIKSNFVNIKHELKKRNIDKVDGILFDLGVSSPQLDEKDRGFSFHENAKLDMRMDQTANLTAYEVVNNYEYKKLVTIFKEYGEEKYANSIAKKIIDSRPITTTLELVEVIKSSVPFKYQREKHPARKVFQAIRIEVNNELEVFKNALLDSLDLLNINGRICVITFHSLEDKICKDIFRKVSVPPKELNNLPIIPDEYLPKFKVINTILPSNGEINKNNRARSSRLRVIERVR